MNLKFESVVENLDESLSKNLEKSASEKELEGALNDADTVMKSALENGLETKKELVIKNASDEKIAAIEVGETKVVQKSAEKESTLLTKNDAIDILENKKMEELGINPKAGANKLQNFIEKAEKLGFIGKLLASAGRIGGTLVDSIAKKYLKDKFKINYSTYNDGKKALTAAIKKDGETFIKKGFDVIFSGFKKLPSTTKMVFRNVKNKIVEEVFSLGKFLIAK